MVIAAQPAVLVLKQVHAAGAGVGTRSGVPRGGEGYVPGRPQGLVDVRAGVVGIDDALAVLGACAGPRAGLVGRLQPGDVLAAQGSLIEVACCGPQLGGLVFGEAGQGCPVTVLHGVVGAARMQAVRKQDVPASAARLDGDDAPGGDDHAVRVGLTGHPGELGVAGRQGAAVRDLVPAPTGALRGEIDGPVRGGVQPLRIEAVLVEVDDLCPTADRAAHEGEPRGLGVAGPFGDLGGVGAFLLVDLPGDPGALVRAHGDDAASPGGHGQCERQEAGVGRHEESFGSSSSSKGWFMVAHPVTA